MIELTIALPDALEQWIAARVSERGYADAAEYVRDLLRRDQEQGEEDLAHLRALIEEGFASGTIDEEPEAILDQIVTERRARYG